MPGRMSGLWSFLLMELAKQDGALVTHGAVLCDVTSGSYLFFGDHVPKKYVEDWMESGKKQVIARLNFFPFGLQR